MNNLMKSIIIIIIINGILIEIPGMKSERSLYYFSWLHTVLTVNENDKSSETESFSSTRKK